MMPGTLLAARTSSPPSACGTRVATSLLTLKRKGIGILRMIWGNRVRLPGGSPGSSIKCHLSAFSRGRTQGYAAAQRALGLLGKKHVSS